MSDMPATLALIRSEMARVEERLREVVKTTQEPVAAMLRHVLATGKRLRPALVILTGRMLNTPKEATLTLAAAVEMLHTATLIHDDILDDASSRRGNETLHTRWPIATAVLAGDVLLAQAAWTIAKLDRSRIVRIFAETLAIVCTGQVRETHILKGHHVNRQDYEENIAAKTAVLFAAAAEMVGLITDGDTQQITALCTFGHELGMAFQIVDDVLDFVGDEVALGKSRGSDLRQGIMTLPTLLYLEEAQDPTPVTDVLSGERDEAHVRAAIEAVCSSSAIEWAMDEARERAEQSRAGLLQLPDNRWRELLSTLIEYVLTRTH